MTMKKSAILSQNPGETKMTMGMDLLLKVHGVKGDYKTRLVGMHPFDCLIMTLPRIPGFVNTVRKDEELLVRYMAEGTVYGFRTQIIDHMLKPVPLLFTAYPQQLERYELRKDTRLNCFIPATLHTAVSHYPTYIVDLSEGGCRTNSPGEKQAPQTSVDEQVVLELKLCGSDRLLMTSATVRNFQEMEGVVSLGLSFEAIEPEAKQSLRNFLEQGRLFS